MDARHHPFDVISGSFLGAVVAWCSYRQYFGPLSDPWRKGRAYPIRTWATEPAAPDSTALDREVSRHQGVEPLRARAREDEEQYAPASEPAVPEATGRPEENVFRKQISQSQRRRQHDTPRAPFGPAAYATVPETRNPFPPASAPPMPQPRRSDGYWSSSDSDNEEEGYELHQQYTLSNPQGDSAHHLGYDPRLEDFGRDTAYHPPVAASDAEHPHISPEHHGVAPGTGVVDPIPPVRSPPPQHVGLSSPREASKTRGVDLVETYAK